MDLLGEQDPLAVPPLEPRECANDESSSDCVSRLFPGLRVRLHGLQTHTEFNGRVGTMLGFEGGRYFVRLDVQNDLATVMVKLKASNVSPLGEETSAEADGAAADADGAAADADADASPRQSVHSDATQPPPPPPRWGSARPRKARRDTDAEVNKERQEAVRGAFVHSWKAYEKYAWASDDLKPVSKQGLNWLYLGGTIVDSLDTLLLMGLNAEYRRSIEWVKTSLHFEVDTEVPLLEATIRVLGGLLSAYELSDPSGRGRAGNPLLLQKATDLADRLMCAFKSASGVAYGNVNLATGVARNLDISGHSVLAEAGSLQLEFNALSRHTGNRSYADAAMRLYDVLKPLANRDGLFGLRYNTATGEAVTESISLGGLGDSFYEYLLKVFLQTGDQKARGLYDKAAPAAIKHLVRTASKTGLLYMSDMENGQISDKMEHLTCFAGGMFALGSVMFTHDSNQLHVGKELTKTCYQMYRRTASGLAPEDVTFKSGDLEIGHGINLLRPETVESLFVLWRLTHDRRYREWGWQIFKAFEAHCRVEHGGYSGLLSVDKPTDNPLDDRMHSFWMAETLKYLYLLFGADEVLPLDEYVFNTEAHPIRRWYRSPNSPKRK